jgi:hypothetical protein
MLTNDIRISVLVICCLFLSLLGVDGAPLNWFPHPFQPAGANSAMEKILSDYYDNKVGDNRPFIVEDNFFDLSADQFGAYLKFIRNQGSRFLISCLSRVNFRVQFVVRFYFSASNRRKACQKH